MAETQETLEFTQRYLQACIVPFPGLDDDKLIKAGIGNKLEVERVKISQESAANPRPKYSRRKPMQLYKDLFRENPILKVALAILSLYTLCIFIASLTRNLFYDQFVSMIIFGQVFIFIHFNILLAYKMIVRTHSSPSYGRTGDP